LKTDGGQHSDDEARQYDEKRSAVLSEKGIRIIRFSDYEILKHPDAVQATIYRELTAGPLRSPAPEYRGRG
jgi:very-short-patch-repair endonuclease